MVTMQEDSIQDEPSLIESRQESAAFSTLRRSQAVRCQSRAARSRGEGPKVVLAQEVSPPQNDLKRSTSTPNASHQDAHKRHKPSDSGVSLSQEREIPPPLRIVIPPDHERQKDSQTGSTSEVSPFLPDGSSSDGAANGPSPGTDISPISSTTDHSEVLESPISNILSDYMQMDCESSTEDLCPEEEAPVMFDIFRLFRLPVEDDNLSVIMPSLAEVEWAEKVADVLFCLCYFDDAFQCYLNAWKRMMQMQSDHWKEQRAMIYCVRSAVTSSQIRTIRDLLEQKLELVNVVDDEHSTVVRCILLHMLLADLYSRESVNDVAVEHLRKASKLFKDLDTALRAHWTNVVEMDMLTSLYLNRCFNCFTETSMGPIIGALPPEADDLNHLMRSHRVNLRLDDYLLDVASSTVSEKRCRQNILLRELLDWCFHQLKSNPALLVCVNILEISNDPDWGLQTSVFLFLWKHWYEHGESSFGHSSTWVEWIVGLSIAEILAVITQTIIGIAPPLATTLFSDQGHVEYYESFCREFQFNFIREKHLARPFTTDLFGCSPQGMAVDFAVNVLSGQVEFDTIETDQSPSAEAYGEFVDPSILKAELSTIYEADDVESPKVTTLISLIDWGARSRHQIPLSSDLDSSNMAGGDLSRGSSTYDPLLGRATSASEMGSFRRFAKKLGVARNTSASTTASKWSWGSKLSGNSTSSNWMRKADAMSRLSMDRASIDRLSMDQSSMRRLSESMESLVLQGSKVSKNVRSVKGSIKSIEEE